MTARPEPEANLVYGNKIAVAISASRWRLLVRTNIFATKFPAVRKIDAVVEPIECLGSI